MRSNTYPVTFAECFSTVNSDLRTDECRIRECWQPRDEIAEFRGPPFAEIDFLQSAGIIFAHNEFLDISSLRFWNCVILQCSYLSVALPCCIAAICFNSSVSVSGLPQKLRNQMTKGCSESSSRCVFKKRYVL